MGKRPSVGNQFCKLWEKPTVECCVVINKDWAGLNLPTGERAPAKWGIPLLTNLLSIMEGTRRVYMQRAVPLTQRSRIMAERLGHTVVRAITCSSQVCSTLTV